MGILRTLAVALLLSSLTGCGGSPGPAAPAADPLFPDPGIPLAVLPFPNDLATVERQASDDTVTLLGRDWHEKSESAVEIGSTLSLNDGESAWGIYALGGFGQVQPGSVYASFFTEDDMPCRIFLGVADFASGHWRFMDAGKDDASYTFPAGGNYTSPSGNCYVVVLRSGDGKAKLYELIFGRVGNTNLESPAGLSATADPGLVSLDWLPVNGAVGYNVYRAYDRKFTDQVKLNAVPVAEDSYADSWLVNGEMYFYRVTAVAAIESKYSNALGVFVPAVDLPAPQNLRVLEVGDFHFRIAWDWEGASPASWAVYMANAPDFNLEPPTVKKDILQGGTREYTFSNLDPGRLYFVRMAAKDSSGRHGRMTEALPCLTGDQWEWYDIEEIGDGKEPICAVIADDKICASYMLDHVVHVARNSGAGLPWIVEGTDLDRTVSAPGEEPVGDGFSSFLDIDYRDGTYLITSVTSQTLDYYSAIGAPGVGWDVQLIDKGIGGGLCAPAAGLFCSAAISDNGYNGAGLDACPGKYCHYSRAYGKDKEWIKQEIRTVPEGWPLEFDMETLDGKLFGGLYDYSLRQLYLWSEQNGFSQVTDNPDGWTYGLQYGDLERVDGKWTLTAYYGYERNLIMLQDIGDPVWEQTIITNSEDYRTGRGARMEPFRDGLVVVYMGGAIRDWYCSVLHGNGEWETQLMKIGEIDAYERADLKVLNDKPVLIVADKITQKVYAIRGNIPPE